jgi:pyruvate,water dikinase
MAAPERSPVLTALGGSPGVAEGRVRVVDDPFETDLEDGEVLVCANTDPSWGLYLN